MSERSKFVLAANGPTRRQMIFGAAATLGGIAVVSRSARAGDEMGISHTAEAIHQEPVFKASKKRVYEALTDARQFDKVVQMSAAMQSGMVPAKSPAEISREVGGAFSLFGGYVTGRQIELVPNERIVEVWRAGSWGPGDYSIARFALAEEGSGTKIIFDHTGFPGSQAQHLADGWKMNYWEPLAKFLAESEMK